MAKAKPDPKLDDAAHALRYAASCRVVSAIKHLEAARAQLDAACADISSIIGASADYNRIRKLSIGIVEARRYLDENHHQSTTGASAFAGHQWKLDHEPKSDQDCEHGCNLRKV